MTAATIDADLPPELERPVADRLERTRRDHVIERMAATADDPTNDDLEKEIP